MEVVVERCCGLDVHQRSVVACLLTHSSGAKPRKEVREFGTFTEDLEMLRAWLVENDCQQVAMESTGVYWMPVYAVLEDSFDIVVGNATHLKNVPGRKTDVKDAEWIAQLLMAGLIRRSYVPVMEIRTLRKLVRYRRALIAGRTGERNRLLKLLEEANIKLGSVATDVFGVSGWAMLEALVENNCTVEQMAQLAKGRLRNKLEELYKALDGRLDDADRWLLKAQMARIKNINDNLAAVEAKIDEQLSSHSELRERLTQIPGVSHVVSAAIIAEIGTNVDAFPTERHLAKWAGLCPGNNESAGKRFSGRAAKGNEYLRTVLVEAANAAVRTKGTYYQAKYYRLKARRGHKRAVFAVAHKILRAVWHMIKTGDDFKDLGANYLDNRDQKRLTRKHIKKLEELGYQVQIVRHEEQEAQPD